VSAWLALLAAGLLEIAWAFGLKYSDGLTRFWPTAATLVAIALSFALMAIAAVRHRLCGLDWDRSHRHHRRGNADLQ
jgi:multidrug transporter EmrE-like cation transporter